MTSPQPHPTQWIGQPVPSDGSQPVPGYGQRAWGHGLQAWRDRQQAPGHGQPIPGQRQPPGYDRPSFSPSQPWYGDPGVPAGLQGYPAGWAVDLPVDRPGTLLAGLVLTYIGAGFMALLGLGLLIGASDGALVRALSIAPGARGSSVVLFVVLALVLLVFSAVLIVPAVLAQRGRSGGRIALTAIGGSALVLDLIELVTAAQPTTLLSLLWVAAAVTLLWVGSANDWFRWMAQARIQGR